jgi:hypothetical protein
LFLPAGILVTAAGSHGSAPRLIVSPEIIDMGEVRAGGSKAVAFTVTNAGPAPLTVGRVDTSCDCLRVLVPKDIIVAGEMVEAVAAVDFSGDPGFSGSLLIEVLGREGETMTAFTMAVHVRVR